MVYRPLQQKAAYYDKLAPYRNIFREGVPILIYHKLGTPPQRVRMGGLYVKAHVFARQLDEFRGAGFRTIRLDGWRSFAKPNNRQFVITFDDGSATVFHLSSSLLGSFGFSAIQYIVADQIGGRNEWDVVKGEVEDRLMDESQIRAWLAAGHEIGSHTLTHCRLTQLDKKRAREEVFSSKKKLEDLFGVPIRHFCYPYGSWERWVRDLVEEAGYETAVTANAGICAEVTDPFTLPRIDVRRPPRNFKNFWSRFVPWTM